MFQGCFDAMLYVTDVVRSCRFYRDVLGFTIEGWWDDATHQYTSEPRAGEQVAYCAMRAGEQPIALHLTDDPAHTGGGAVYHLKVADIDACVGAIRARGGEATDPTDQPWGWRQAIVADPDGHLWAFYTPLSR